MLTPFRSDGVKRRRPRRVRRLVDHRWKQPNTPQYGQLDVQRVDQPQLVASRPCAKQKLSDRVSLDRAVMSSCRDAAQIGDAKCVPVAAIHFSVVAASGRSPVRRKWSATRSKYCS